MACRSLHDRSYALPQHRSRGLLSFEGSCSRGGSGGQGFHARSNVQVIGSLTGSGGVLPGRTTSRVELHLLHHSVHHVFIISLQDRRWSLDDLLKTRATEDARLPGRPSRLRGCVHKMGGHLHNEGLYDVHFQRKHHSSVLRWNEKYICHSIRVCEVSRRELPGEHGV